jgi:transcriptional regulator with XRE-family HTH domain
MQAEICTRFAADVVFAQSGGVVAGELAANIRRLRKGKHLTQLQLARGIGIQTATQVSLWESNKQKVSRENIAKLSRFFSVSVEELDPERETWDAEQSRAERHTQANNNPPSHSHVAAPPLNPAGVEMGPGDQALFAQVEGAWKLLRNDEERRAFVEHVRGFVHSATAPEAARKKAAR